jgi:hypothetical protein
MRDISGRRREPVAVRNKVLVSARYKGQPDLATCNQVVSVARAGFTHTALYGVYELIGIDQASREGADKTVDHVLGHTAAPPLI